MIYVFPPTNPYINPLFPFIFISPFTLLVFETPFSSRICSPSSSTMAKTRGAHSYWSRVRWSSTLHYDTSTQGVAVTAGLNAPAACPSAAAVTGPSAPAVRPSAATIASLASAVVQGTAPADVEGFSSVVPAQRRYYTRVGPTPPVPSHPRPAQRAPPPKRARTSGPRDLSTSRPRAPPSPHYQGIAGAPDLSPASIIKRPYFPCSPISGNIDYKGRDFHGEVYYDLPAFSEDPEL